MSAISDREIPRREARHLLRDLARRWNEAQPFVPVARREWPIALRRARLAGFAVLCVQFLVLASWSHMLVSRFSLTWDFSFYQQALYLIAHGNLNPYSTVFIVDHPFWQNLGEFIFWPLAIFERIWPHPITLKILQDLALVGAETIALLWICDIAADRARRGVAVKTCVGLIALGVVLLVANPWVYWAAAFDVHNEPFGAFFLAGAARDIHRGRRTVWIWALLTVLCGAAEATYIAALGISAVISGRHRSRQGITMLVLSMVWLVFLSAIHGEGGAGLGEYASLVGASAAKKTVSTSPAVSIVKAVIEHPGNVLRTLWENHTKAWAILSPTGVLGIFWLPVLLPTLLIAGESALSTPTIGFSSPGNQNVALVPLAIVGTVVFCAFLASRRSRHARWLQTGLVALFAANAIVWVVVWLPQLNTTWLRVPSSAATVLKRVENRIGPQDEVIVSQGVAGSFANRKALYAIQDGDWTDTAHSLQEGKSPSSGDTPTSTSFPVRARKVWIIITPAIGIETTPTAQMYANIQQLRADPQMRMVADSQGVWAFEWSPRPTTKQITFGASVYAATPGWLIPGTSGAAVQRGPLAAWHAASTGQAGYVIDGAYWPGARGSYTATAKLKVSGTAAVEIWNDTTGRLLARQVVTSTQKIKTVRLRVRLNKQGVGSDTAGLFRGHGLWASTPVPTPGGNNLEVRVWSPGGVNHTSVYSVQLAPTA